MNLNNQVAIITGGTQGIGKKTALMLAAEGVDICLVARNTVCNDLQEEIIALGVRCHMITADLSDPAECLRVVKETADVFSKINILVHCAGSSAGGGLLNGAANVWYKAFDIHLHAAFHLCHAAVPVIQQNNGGAIIFISSAAGIRGIKNALAYATVKGALPQFTRALAFELSTSNIRVNCVSPGVIRTRFQDYLTKEQIKNNIENRIPLAKEGTPLDVAAVICMLIKNEFITGENVNVDGGMTMRMV